MRFANWLLEEQSILVPINKLFAWEPKIQETINDIKEGRLSRNSGSPVIISRLDSPRGSFFVMDGHHRVIEAFLAGKSNIQSQIDLYMPRIERTGGSFSTMIDNKMRISDIRIDIFQN